MMETICYNSINHIYGSNNRHKLAIPSELDKCARNKYNSRSEYKCRQRHNFAFQYIIICILFSSFIIKVDSSLISRVGGSIAPVVNETNIAKKNVKESPFLAPFKDNEKGKVSDATMPSIDPYASKLLNSLGMMPNDSSREDLEFEKRVDDIQNKLPFGNGLKYDSKGRSFEITEDKPAAMGGIFQSILDAETELRYKHRDNVRIEYNIQTYVTKETAKIIDALQNKNIKALRENHQLVFARLIEPLRTVVAIKKFAREQLYIMETFNKEWYESAKPAAKLRLVTKIDQLVANVPTQKNTPSLFTKVSRTRAFLKSKYTSELMNLATEIRAQKIIREYMQGVKVLRHYANFNAMYLAPYYTDIVPALGSTWLNHLFDKYYMATVHASEAELAEHLPLLMTRFLMMIEQNAITVTDDDFQKAIYAFSLAVSKVMVDKKVNKYKFPRAEYYGFVGLCNDKCEGRLFAELNGTLDNTSKVVKLLRRNLGPKKIPASTGLKFIRWVMTYQKTELMVIETFAEKVIIQLILRTNNIDVEQVVKYQQSAQNNVKLNIDIKSADPDNPQGGNVLKGGNNPQNVMPARLQGHEFVQKSFKRVLRNVKNKAGRVLNPNKVKRAYRKVQRGYRAGANYVKKTPLVRWMLSGVDKLNKMRKRGDVYVSNSFVNVLKPSLGLDSNILSTHSFIKDLVEVGVGNEALSNWYNYTMQAWIQISSAHSSLHGFDPQMDKDVHMSRSLGALFRWLNSTDTRNSITFTNRDKTVLSSLSLQLAFFMFNSVAMYKKGKFGRFLVKFGNIFKMGKTSTVAADWEGLNDALEPKAVVSRPKFVNASKTINVLVRMFEDKFIVKPSIPARLIQLVAIFIGMWTKNQQQVLDMKSNKIEPARKHFYLSLLSNKGIPREAARMIIEHCRVKSRRRALHLGCINKVNGADVKCRPVRIRLVKSSLLKVIEELHGTLDDPLDMLRMASDLSKRCIAHNTQRAVHVPNKKKFLSKIKRNLYGREEYTGATLLASEFSQRLHCYHLQKKVARRLVKRLKGIRDIEQIKEIFNKVLHDFQSMEIKMKSQNGFGAHKLMCQFMDANNPNIVKIFKARLLKYGIAHSGIASKKGLSEKDIETIISLDIKTQNEYAKEIHNYHSYILVGTRFFNSITYRGGYPPNHIFETQKQVQNDGQSRLVFNGNGFVDELQELKVADPVNNITIEPVPGETTTYRRYYHLTNGEKLDEYDYALKANNFVVTGSVLTTSRALAENGYDSGMIIWCGYKYGWVADFALRDVIHDINAVPLFNGRNWVLSTETRIKDFIGGSANNTFGMSNDNLDKKIDDVNVVYKFDNGTSVDAKAQNDASYLKGVFGKMDPVNTVQGNQPPVFSTESADVLPGAVGNLVKNTEFKKDTNTLVIDLNAPDSIIKANAGGVNFVRFNTPPNANYESEALKKAN